VVTLEVFDWVLFAHCSLPGGVCVMRCKRESSVDIELAG
jgi:hypothetical protein